MRNYFWHVMISGEAILLSLLLIFCYTSNGAINYPITNNVPKVYLTINKEISDNYVSSQLTTVQGKEKNTYNNVLIKWRGNTTKYAEKKPYQIKFSQENELFNMNASKKYILLANMYDPTRLRNKIVYDFAYNVSDSYSVQSQFVDLYLNNEYIGNYLLTEKIEDDENKVDIDISSGDYLLEYEYRRYDESKNYIVTNKNNWRFLVKEMKNFADDNEEQLLSYFDRIENILEQDDYNKIKKYIDVNSFVNHYVIQEYFKDVDSGYSSEYYYFKDKKLYAGPQWDYDLSMGFVMAPLGNDTYYNRNGSGNNSNHSYEGLYCLRNIYQKLWHYREFRRLVQDRYVKLQPYIRNLYETKDTKYSVIDQYYAIYKDTLQKDICKWNKEVCYSNNLELKKEELKKWLKLRNEWLLTEFRIVYK